MERRNGMEKVYDQTDWKVRDSGQDHEHIRIVWT